MEVLDIFIALLHEVGQDEPYLFVDLSEVIWFRRHFHSDRIFKIADHQKSKVFEFDRSFNCLVRADVSISSSLYSGRTLKFALSA